MKLRRTRQSSVVPDELSAPPSLLIERVEEEGARAREYVGMLIEQVRSGNVVERFDDARNVAANVTSVLKSVLPYLADRFAAMMEEGDVLTADSGRTYTMRTISGQRGLIVDWGRQCSCKICCIGPENPRIALFQTHRQKIKCDWTKMDFVNGATDTDEHHFLDDLPSLIVKAPRLFSKGADGTQYGNAIELLFALTNSPEELQQLERRLHAMEVRQISISDAANLNEFQRLTGKAIDPVAWFALANLSLRRKENIALHKEAATKLIELLTTVAPGEKATIDGAIFAIKPDENRNLRLFMDKDAIDPETAPVERLFSVVARGIALCRAFGALRLTPMAGASLPSVQERLSL